MNYFSRVRMSQVSINCIQVRYQGSGVQIAKVDCIGLIIYQINLFSLLVS